MAATSITANTQAKAQPWTEQTIDFGKALRLPKTAPFLSRFINGWERFIGDCTQGQITYYKNCSESSLDNLEDISLIESLTSDGMDVWDSLNLKLAMDSGVKSLPELAARRDRLKESIDTRRARFIPA